MQSNANRIAALARLIRVLKSIGSLPLALLGGLLAIVPAHAEPFASCLPSAWAQVATSRRPSPDAVLPFNVLIDVTKSMAGFYAQPSSETDDFNAARLYAVMDDAAAAVSSKPRYYQFGSEVSSDPLTEKEVAAADRSQFYLGPDSNVTALDKAIEFAARQPRGSLTVIISDLFITDDLRKVRETRMSSKIRDAIRAGNTVGIWGVTALFKGTAYDIPGPIRSYNGARSRPIFLLMIGDDQRMQAFQKNLDDLLDNPHPVEEIYAPRPLPEHAGELQFDPNATTAVRQAYDLANRKLHANQFRGREGADIPLKMVRAAPDAMRANIGVQESVWRLLPGDDGCSWAPIPWADEISRQKGYSVELRSGDILVSLKEASGVFEQRALFAVQADLIAGLPAHFKDFSKLSADDAVVAAAVRTRRPFLPARNLAPLVERIKSETAHVFASRTVARAQFLILWEPQ